MQVSSLTSAFSVTLIASTGHADAQAAQPVQVALSTFTTIMVLPRWTLILVFLFIFSPWKLSWKKGEYPPVPSSLLFWFILFQFFVRPSPTKCKIQIHDPKLKTKKNKEIQERDRNLPGHKPIRQRDWSEERDEHPNQNQQQDLYDICIFPHSRPDNTHPIKSYFWSIPRWAMVNISLYQPGETLHSCEGNSLDRRHCTAHRKCTVQDTLLSSSHHPWRE